MDQIDNEKEESSNEEENAYERENERKSLKEKTKKDENYNTYKRRKKNKTQNCCMKALLFFLVVLLLSFVAIVIFYQIASNEKLNNIKNKYNLRNNILNKNNNNNPPLNENMNINKPNNDLVKENSKEKNVETEKDKNKPIIEYIKNVDIKNLNDTINSMSNEILAKNGTKRKIGLAFLYSTLSANGIGRFITVTAKYLLPTGKYNIYFITEKPYNREFSYDPSIKRFIAYNNYTLLRNVSKYEKIDIVVLQNVLSKSVVKFHHNLGQKVICMFHGIFMSAMYGNHVDGYKNWIQFDACDSFIFIGPDDYYFYNKLGFQNHIFVPNLYTFDPYEVASSNLTTHNIVILGRLNDWIKGVKYAIRAMETIVKEVPDAKLYLVSSDSRTQFLKNLTRDLNLTQSIVFRGGTFNLSQLFWNCSVHMYTSLSEAFPMALVEGKAHGLPLVGFTVPYSLPYQQGFIGVELFDIPGLARETIKLLKDYDYRKRMGEISKKSLDVVKNNETVELWGRLCDSLLNNNTEDYRKLQKEVEAKYYNETRAREHLESHYNILLRNNFNLTCHSFDNFTDINYLKTIQKCNMTGIYINTSLFSK